jgi:hypothetical protein
MGHVVIIHVLWVYDFGRTRANDRRQPKTGHRVARETVVSPHSLSLLPDLIRQSIFKDGDIGGI